MVLVLRLDELVWISIEFRDLCCQIDAVPKVWVDSSGDNDNSARTLAT